MNFLTRSICILIVLMPFCLAANDNLSKKRILIGSPIRQKPAILKEFLQSLEELTQNSFEAHYYFIDDNTDPESIQILEDFATKHCQPGYRHHNNLDRKVVLAKAADAGDTYICNEKTHYWSEQTIWKVALFKNIIIEYALNQSYDYLFLIDSDIVLYPNTIEQLIADEKDIISEIFWTRWQPESPKLPQVWLYDNYTLHETHYGEKLTNEETNGRITTFLQMLMQPGVYEVGGLGACTLISKKALEKGVNFKKISNITFWGEDRHFCVRAVALGLQLFVDTHYPAYHIYRESYLEGVAQFKENCRNGIYQI